MIPSDKAAHFGVSFALTIFGFSIYMDWWLIAGIVFGIGIGKEVWDSRQRDIPGIDLGDIFANVLGIGFAIICLRRILFLVWF